MTIVGEKLNSANIKVKSTENTTYDIESNIQVSDNKVTSFDSGAVTRISDKAQVATFNSYNYMSVDGNSLSITYTGVDNVEQCSINTEVNKFITAVKAVNPSELYKM